jgi:hypothetical protein
MIHRAALLLESSELSREELSRILIEHIDSIARATHDKAKIIVNDMMEDKQDG